LSAEFTILLVTAVSIAFLHTLSGPDHYLPFVAIARAKNWSYSRTIWWTVICGSGHVWSSVLLGLGGGLIGWSMSKISWIESVRGGLAGWSLLIFGFLYGCWGLLQAYRNRRHKHFEEVEGELYVYEHKHESAVRPAEKHKVTPWVLFVIFLLGPCEPMIPLLYFPAAQNSWKEMGLMIIVYTIITLLTMILMVSLCLSGVRLLKTETLELYMHALGGLTIFICGLGMVFLNW
jgi:sulfite exporter TauE/SafE